MKHAFFMLLLFCSIQANALTVVADLGGESIIPYFDDLNIINTDTNSSPQYQANLPQELLSESDFLPIKSIELNVGYVEKRQVDLQGLSPLFLIGDDDASMTWLQKKQPLLKKIGAIGLVVNVSSQQGLNRLRKHAKDIQIYPVAADDLARRLELAHYPVLITANSIEQ